jgi:hypothetical protein
LEKGVALGFKSGNIAWLAVGAGWKVAPGSQAFRAWLFLCGYVLVMLVNLLFLKLGAGRKKIQKGA